MRFRSTKAFNQKLVATTAAHRDCISEITRNDESDEAAAAVAAHMSSVIECLQHPAVTPTELCHKLILYRDHNVGSWSAEGRDAFEAIINDTTTLQGHYPGPAMFEALADWRKVEEIYQYAPDLESDEGNRICNARSSAFRALMSTPCTTAGDFIAKTYINLLGLLGHTWLGTNREAGWGNIFDINIAIEDDERDDTCAFHRAAYFDIDHSDIGANLLAYGQPHFSAELWMERADAIGLRVGLIAVNGVRTLWQSMDIEADFGTAPYREADRLRRLIAFDHRVRTTEVMEEIERDWPQLVSSSSATGAGT
jgi:hypothetical protein